MPVWHELTKELRASGELKVIGLVQEQHAERCQLWAQWQQIDWPILWDPYNMTGSKVVPIAMAVDEQGVIRNNRLHPKKFEQQFVREFMEMQFPAQIGVGSGEKLRPPLSWKEAYADLYNKTQADPENAVAWFRLGVALRMRFDDPTHAQADDFQKAIECWHRALALNPSQYIWRRRIQQWGPRLDKPYPFFEWVEQAQAEIRERGEKPVALPVPVIPAAVPSGEGSEAVAQNAFPDNDGRVPRDKDGWVDLITTMVFHTRNVGKPSKEDSWKDEVIRVHLQLQPDAQHEVKWSWDAGPCQIWLYDADGWQIEQDYFSLHPSEEPDASKQGVNFEIRRTAEKAAPSVKGVIYYFVCSGDSGECTFMAKDFSLTMMPPSKFLEQTLDQRKTKR